MYPMTNVSRALRNPMFLSPFVVQRRLQMINVNGRATVKTQNINAVGVVCAASPNDLLRLDDKELMYRHLSIVTEFRLQGPAKDSKGNSYQPDYVIWEGNNYIVKLIEPYPRYGPGFVQAIAGSIDSIDQAVPTNP